MFPSPAKTFTSPILVGRHTELEQLRGFITRTATEGGQAVLISGEAGIGKSRLIAEGKVYASSLGFHWIEAQCFQTDTAFPYAPFSDLLRTLLELSLDPQRTAELKPLIDELYLLLPDLAPIPASAPRSAIDPEQKKRRLFSIVAEFLFRYATNQAVMLIVEDVHWSDESSLELLHYLTRRLVNQPFLLVMTYRSDEVASNLRHWLAQWDRDRLAQELALSPLSRDEIQTMLGAIFQRHSPVRTDFRDAIYALTEGNPFFVEEVVKSLVVNGDIYLAEEGWDGKPVSALRIPRTVQDAVYQRFERLSESAREVVSLAAVMGRQFDFELLQHLTAHSDIQLLGLMKELIACQLIVEESAERFVFRHALTREALYNRLLSRERKILHHAIAQAIEAHVDTPQGRYITELAYHHYQAGTWSKARQYSIQAGEQAQSVYAIRAAVDHFTRALEASERLSETPPLGLYRARALAYEMAGELKLAQSDLEALLRHARLVEDRQLEWQALIDLGSLWAGQDYTQTGRYYQSAFELAQELNLPRERAESLNRLGNWHINVERPLEAHWHHQEALSLFQQLDDPHGIADTLDSLAMASLLGSNLVQADSYFTRAVDSFSALEQRQRLLFSLAPMPIRGPTYQTDTMVSAVNTLTEAAQEGEAALRVALEIGHRSGEAFAKIVLGACLGSKGDYERACDLLSSALVIAREIGHRQWECYANIILGLVYFDVLAHSASADCLSKAMRLAEETHSLHWLRTSAGGLAMCYVEQHQLEPAQTLLDSVLDLTLPPRTLGLRLLWRARVELALARGDGALALESIERLVTSAFNLSSSTIVPRLSKLHGDALVLLGQTGAAEAELRKALDGAFRQEALPVVWRTHVSLARLYEQKLRLQDVETCGDAARQIIDQLAVAMPEALRESFCLQAYAMLPRSQPPAKQPRKRAGLHGLTGREEEIAVLLGRGKTNRQIADKLVISERTAETHIGNILSKLNMTSRSQIALWAVEVGLLHERPSTTSG